MWRSSLGHTMVRGICDVIERAGLRVAVTAIVLATALPAAAAHVVLRSRTEGFTARGTIELTENVPALRTTPRHLSFPVEIPGVADLEIPSGEWRVDVVAPNAWFAGSLEEIAPHRSLTVDVRRAGRVEWPIVGEGAGGSAATIPFSPVEPARGLPSGAAHLS